MKLSNEGVDPIFAACIRSAIAGLGLAAWMKLLKLKLFPGSVWDGLAVGVIFGLEFAFLFSSILYTTIASAWILLYSTPFFHAIGAHFFLKGDRLSFNKILGLILAFIGIVVLLSKHLDLPSAKQILGDGLALGAAVLWAATTIYIKRRLVGKVSPFHTLFYQTFFSVPILLALSLVFQEAPIRHLDGVIIGSLLFQGLIVAFVSYLLWFYLVHEYPVSRLSSFTFLTPVFATAAGILFLNEPLSLRLILALVLVSAGIYVVNRQ